MAEFFREYVKATDPWRILDLLVCAITMVAFIVFLKRKNNGKVIAFFLSYTFVIVLIRFAIAFNLSQNKSVVFELTNELITYINIFIIVSFVIIYQNDFKSVIVRITKKSTGTHFHNSYSNSDDDLIHASQEIVRAAQNMSKNDIGALIVIVPTALPEHILATGTMLNSELSCALLESIFNPHSPLHDGAVIVSGNCIVAAGCFLPLSQEVNIDKELGTRHRAAIGITEQSDVLTVVVSEETGIISTVYNGEIKRYITPEKLINTIQSIYGISNVRDSKRIK